jgi:hypothetical protein
VERKQKEEKEKRPKKEKKEGKPGKSSSQLIQLRRNKDFSDCDNDRFPKKKKKRWFDLKGLKAF